MTLRISVLMFWDNASISFSFHKNPPQNMLSFSNSLFIQAGRALEPDTSEYDLGDTENLSKLQSILWSLSHSVLIHEMKVPVSLPELFRGWHKTPHVSERVCAPLRTWQDRHTATGHVLIQVKTCNQIASCALTLLMNSTLYISSSDSLWGFPGLCWVAKLLCPCIYKTL